MDVPDTTQKPQRRNLTSHLQSYFLSDFLPETTEAEWTVTKQFNEISKKAWLTFIACKIAALVIIVKEYSVDYFDHVNLKKNVKP